MMKYIDADIPRQKPRSKKAMREYLANHERYHCMNSWNQSTSYARDIKVSHITFPSREVQSVAYDLVGADNDWWYDAGIHQEITAFAERWHHGWQIGTNGRSDGYMVVYQGEYKPSGYKSRCHACGQLNYARVFMLPENPTPEQLFEQYLIGHNTWIETVYPDQPEVKALGLPDEKIHELVRTLRAKYQEYDSDGRKKHGINVTTNNVCGRCHQPARVNFEKTHMVASCWPGRGTDEERDYEEWSKNDLAARVEMVWDFDQTVNECIRLFIDYCKEHKVVEKTILVEKTVRVAVGPDDEDGPDELDEEEDD